jgi:putative copper resistance protein D
LRALYLGSVTVHVLAAMFWLGGMFFLGVVGAPVLRRVQPPELRQHLFNAVGVRFRALSWWAIVVLLATGVLNLRYRGWLTWDSALGAPAFWASATGNALAWKLGAVATMIGVSAMHDFVLGPRAGAAVPGSPEALALRARAVWAARLNALAGVVLVIAAVRLARGG